MGHTESACIKMCQSAASVNEYGNVHPDGYQGTEIHKASAER